MKNERLSIKFVSDGRFYVPSGRKEGEFLIVFGTLVTGPLRPAPGTFVTPFFAEVRRPNDGSPLMYEARLDFPVMDEPPADGPLVLLYGALPKEVPDGSTITSRSSA